MTAVSKPIIAVVDDDPRILESLENLLESAGHAVRLFPSATALLEDGCLADIACLITDIGMPVIDGFELHRRAVQARPELPVILITGRDDLADRQRAMALPLHGFFQKPFDAQVLLAAVGEAVSGQDRDG